MNDIKFGTDGWRGLIADDYTFNNVRRVSAAIAAYVLKHENASKGVVVGYDTRFLSRSFAQAAAEVLAAAGIPVKLANDYVPTPAVSLHIKQSGAAGGIMITSSHNPWNWNGVKFKANFGGSATPAIMKLIEGELSAEAPQIGSPATATKAAIDDIDLTSPYIDAVCKFAGTANLAQRGFHFAVDSMYGSGRGILARIFTQAGVKFTAIRQEVNPLFPGINPEPIEPHIAMLRETVLREKCDAGLATDGDADRIGAVAEDGSFVDSHKIICIILRWLLERRDWHGDVVRAFNTTKMIDRITAAHGRKLYECAIGFKYIADLMMEHEILIGGEESGGIGYSRYLPERDGILNCLLLANVMAEEGKTLGQLVASLQRDFGPHYYGRRDMHITDTVKKNAIQRAAADATKTLGPYTILRKESMDGIKFFLDLPKGSVIPEKAAEPWVLFRASGTEPLLRVYAEASSPQLVNEILATSETFVTAAHT